MNGDQRHQVGIPENRMKRENYILMDKLDYIDHLEGNLRKTTVLALAKMLSLFNVFESTLFSKERLSKSRGLDAVRMEKTPTDSLL